MEEDGESNSAMGGVELTVRELESRELERRATSDEQWTFQIFSYYFSAR